MRAERALAIARSDLRMLWRSKDFWVPMTLLAGLFFVVIPAALLLAITRIGTVELVSKISQTLEILPQSVQASIEGDTPQAQASYALAVFLLAPLAIVVPLTISTAVGAHVVVGERERGSGEFLAHSPATESEIYAGKLIASLLPGYAATLAGFGLYSLIVNLIVGPQLGRWFFPTAEWWVLMFWVVPPFIALALSLVLRMSARVRSAAAAQQSSALVTLPLILLAYALTSGALFGTGALGWITGLIAWIGAALGLSRGRTAVTRERLLGVDAAGRLITPDA